MIEDFFVSSVSIIRIETWVDEFVLQFINGHNLRTKWFETTSSLRELFSPSVNKRFNRFNCDIHPPFLEIRCHGLPFHFRYFSKFICFFREEMTVFAAARTSKPRATKYSLQISVLFKGMMHFMVYLFVKRCLEFSWK